MLHLKSKYGRIRTLVNACLNSVKASLAIEVKKLSLLNFLIYVNFLILPNCLDRANFPIFLDLNNF